MRVSSQRPINDHRIFQIVAVQKTVTLERNIGVAEIRHLKPVTVAVTVSDGAGLNLGNSDWRTVRHVKSGTTIGRAELVLDPDTKLAARHLRRDAWDGNHPICFVGQR